jgi:hypothetical protein
MIRKLRNAINTPIPATVSPATGNVLDNPSLVALELAYKPAMQAGIEARREDNPKQGIIAQKTPIKPKTIEATLDATVQGHSIGWAGLFSTWELVASSTPWGEFGSSI